MKPTAQAFDTSMAAWNDYQQAPWGKLRYRIGQSLLSRHLPGAALQVLDVGGGNGFDAIALAEQGCAVTVVDYSAAMLAQGRKLAEERGAASNITFHQADVTTLPMLCPETTFDVVLCHNVLQYVENPVALLEVIGQVLRPDGILSLMITNPHAETYALALREFDLQSALADLGKKTHFVTGFGVSITRYTDDELIDMLETADFTLIKQYGIRCICDYISDNDRKLAPEFYQQLEDLELALSDKYPFYLLARFYHLIACKKSLEDKT